ncbi:MAG: hypothetical protein JSR82_15770 [Verrucomicrobia bacterium]|nr:hypothetical protein [Verrucomicrobiota bacterium]
MRLWTSTVGWSLAVVALRAGGFLLVLPLALRSLQPEEMGLWYLFVAISDLCATAELGLAGIIGRSASFFLGGLSEFPKDGLHPGVAPAGSRSVNLPGLAGLQAFAGRTYRWIALGVLLGMAVGGVFLVYPKILGLETGRGAHLTAYAVYALAATMAIYGLYWPAFLSGLAQVRLAQRTLLVALLANYATSAVGLLLGLGLMSLALGQLVLAGLTYYLARFYTRRLYPELLATPPQEVRLSQLWPATWRSLLIFMSHNFCSQSSVLVCGVLLDLATTASCGLSVRFGVLAHGVAAVWLSVRAPGISVARAAGRLAEARQLVAGALPRSIATMVVACTGLFFLGAPALQFIGSKTSLLPPLQFAGLLAMLTLDMFVGFHSTVIQTANRYPHLQVMVATAVASVTLAFVFGYVWGVPGILFAPVLAQACCAYWWIPLQCWRDLRT